jgi:limonene-1,2-epoxide hydrolase
MVKNTKLVEDFIAMWDAPQGLDRAVEAYFTPDTVWVNEGLTETTGIEAALEVNRMFGEKLGMDSIKVDMISSAEDGNKVLTERENGKIARWRDYFDSKGALAAQR